jgi:putative ABC transport system permease protein
MGIALGVAIIFNSVTVNVLERRREIAIMRAIGMSSARIAFILTLENLAVGLLGVIIGLPLGYYVASYFFSMYESDLFSMSTVILPRSYIIAALAALIILFISQIPPIRQIYRLRLPTVTKDWSE